MTHNPLTTAQSERIAEILAGLNTYQQNITSSWDIARDVIWRLPEYAGRPARALGYQYAFALDFGPILAWNPTTNLWSQAS